MLGEGVEGGQDSGRGFWRNKDLGRGIKLWEGGAEVAGKQWSVGALEK